jgi:hypothetical protein
MAKKSAVPKYIFNAAFALSERDVNGVLLSIIDAAYDDGAPDLEDDNDSAGSLLEAYNSDRLSKLINLVPLEERLSFVQEALSRAQFDDLSSMLNFDRDESWYWIMNNDRKRWAVKTWIGWADKYMQAELVKLAANKSRADKAKKTAQYKKYVEALKAAGYTVTAPK